MPNRALIIAIQSYDQAAGAASLALAGVHDAARDFYRWLRFTPQLAVDPQQIFVCSDGLKLDDQVLSFTLEGKVFTLNYGATRAEIVRCLVALFNTGREVTENLYVYCAGHGFAYTTDATQDGVSYLLTAEYVSGVETSEACINLDYLQLQFARCFSGKKHFYFVDACRNVIAAESMNPPEKVPVAFVKSNKGVAGRYQLYSAGLGNVAGAGSAFSQALTQGLAGAGYAKQWVGPGMSVTFDGLFRQLQRVLPQQQPDLTVFSRLDPSIYALATVPINTCTVHIAAPAGGGPYLVDVADDDHSVFQKEFPGPDLAFPLKPHLPPYSVSVTEGDVTLTRLTPPASVPIDMFDPCNLIFAPAPPIENEGSSASIASVLESFKHSNSMSLTRSSNWLELVQESFKAERRVLQKRIPQLSAGDLLRNALLARLRSKGALAAGSALLSLVEQSNPGLNLLLLGSSMIAAGEFPAATSGSALVLILSTAGRPHCALHSTPEDLDWQPLAPVEDVPHVFALTLPAPVTAPFFSLRTGTSVVTYPLQTQATACTLITLQTLGSTQMLRIAQPLTGSSEPYERLAIAAKLALAQQAFARYEPVWQQPFASAALFKTMAAQGWADTQLRALCAYDLVRQGDPIPPLLLAPATPQPFAADLALLRGEFINPAQLLLADALLHAQEQDADDEVAIPAPFPFPANRRNYRDPYISWTGVEAIQSDQSSVGASA